MNNRGGYNQRGNNRGMNQQNRGNNRGNYRGRGMSERFRDRDERYEREFDKREEEEEQKIERTPPKEEEEEEQEKKEIPIETPIEIKEEEEEDVQELKKRKIEDEEVQVIEKVEDLQTKESLLSEIDRIEIEITKYETRIEDLEKERQNHFLEEQRKREDTSVVKKKHFQHPFYHENHQRSKESEKEFEHLLYKDQSIVIGKCVEPNTMECYQKNEERHEKMMAEIEKEIESLLKEEEDRIQPISTKYKLLKQEWKRQCTNSLSHSHGGSNTSYIRTLAVVQPLLTLPNREIIFESKNSLVEDPLKENKEAMLIEQSWTPEDKKTFLKKFSQYPKDYKKIHQFLPQKTLGDIINFYYNNKKKNKELMEIIKNLKNSKKYTKKVIDEGFNLSRSTVNSSEISARELRSLGVTPSQAKEMGYLRSRGNNDFIVDEKPKKDDERLRWTDPEKSHYLELFAIYGRNFAEIAKNIKVKNEAQCKNFYNNYKKRLNLDNLLTPEQKNSNQRKKPGKKPLQGTSVPIATVQTFPSEEDHEVNDPSYQGTEKGKKKRQISYWSQEEKDNFMQLYNEHGRDWKKIAELIPTKTQSQVKNFFQNYKVKLGLAPPPEPRNKKKSEEKEEEELDLSAPPITPETFEPKKIIENILSNPILDEKKKDSKIIPPNTSPNPINTQMLIPPNFLMINQNRRITPQTKHARIAPNIPNQIGVDEKKAGISSILNTKENPEVLPNQEFQNLFSSLMMQNIQLTTNPTNLVTKDKKESPNPEKKEESGNFLQLKQPVLEEKKEDKMEEVPKESPKTEEEIPILTKEQMDEIETIKVDIPEINETTKTEEQKKIEEDPSTLFEVLESGEIENKL